MSTSMLDRTVKLLTNVYQSVTSMHVTFLIHLKVHCKNSIYSSESMLLHCNYLQYFSSWYEHNRLSIGYHLLY